MSETDSNPAQNSAAPPVGQHMVQPETGNHAFAMREGCQWCHECDAIVLRYDETQCRISCPCRTDDGDCDPSKLG